LGSGAAAFAHFASEGCGISREDVTRVAGEELIIVTQSSKGFTSSWNDGVESVRWGKRSVLVDYARDVTGMHRHRSDLKAINAWLEEANLEFLSEKEVAGDDGKLEEMDTRQRTLRRIFNLPAGVPIEAFKFNRGGRLYGGWWQQIGNDRRHLIRIDGELIADAMAAGDLYEVPGFEEYREGIKRSSTRCSLPKSR
jgi:hypothetical protein